MPTQRRHPDHVIGSKAGWGDAEAMAGLPNPSLEAAEIAVFLMH